ncbi:hypothetical protein [Streptomyces sp. MMG1121]|uniref:hypothetical protein n=1 Tax=Streptomyces sp. MMG1121 TaxID=1415544 RepID=UPI0006AF9CF3|nr:hypothetical protein [Streptomyces sp. MMG1121]
MGTSSDGYTVRSGVSGQATELDGAGDDAGHIHQAILRDARCARDALGGPEAAAAFDAFAAAWLDDASTLRSALHELAGRVRLAKGAYAGSDHTVATRTESVTVGGDGVTTMPTPVGDEYVTTMPVHADRPSVLRTY